MITKRIKQYILACSVCCGITATLTSCNDFLDILPTNEVVLENYWTEKADVSSVMNSWYETLEHSDCLAWHEWPCGASCAAITCDWVRMSPTKSTKS